MKIALLGGTRGTGRHVLDQALERGHEVKLLARNVSGLPQHPKLLIVQGDARKPNDVAQVVQGADAVVTSVGSSNLKSRERLVSDSAIATVEAMKQHGVKRLVLVSVFGAGPVGLPLRAGLGFFKLVAPAVFENVFEEKNRAEATFAAAGVDYTFVRAPQLTDGPKTGKVTAKLSAAPLPRKISRADVAGFMLDELEKNAFVRQAPIVWA